MSIEELSTESEWHAARAAELFGEVRKMRDRAVTVEITEASELLRSAMQVEFEAAEHLHQSNVLDSVRASRLPYTGTRLVVPATRAYTVGTEAAR